MWRIRGQGRGDAIGRTLEQRAALIGHAGKRLIQAKRQRWIGVISGLAAVVVWLCRDVLQLTDAVSVVIAFTLLSLLMTVLSTRNYAAYIQWRDDGFRKSMEKLADTHLGQDKTERGGNCSHL